MKKKNSWFIAIAIVAVCIYLIDLLMNQQKILLNHESPGGYAAAGVVILIFLFIIWLFSRSRRSNKQ